jgi:hypothetical protein
MVFPPKPELLAWGRLLRRRNILTDPEIAPQMTVPLTSRNNALVFKYSGAFSTPSVPSDGLPYLTL